MPNGSVNSINVKTTNSKAQYLGKNSGKKAERGTASSEGTRERHSHATARHVTTRHVTLQPVTAQTPRSITAQLSLDVLYVYSLHQSLAYT